MCYVQNVSSVAFRREFKTTKLTGGSAVVPVNDAYSWNTSWGLGPNMMKTSMIPLSEIQCVSTWGTSSVPLKNDISEFNMDWKIKEKCNAKGLRKNVLIKSASLDLKTKPASIPAICFAGLYLNLRIFPIESPTRFSLQTYATAALAQFIPEMFYPSGSAWLKKR